jgi:CO/xanthine dehydrogenase Mo-binding subunit
MKDAIPRPGSPFPRQDALHKVTGQERFAVDHYGPDLVWAGVKRAGLPHARLRKIERSKAEKLPGVLAILTHQEVKGSNRQGIIRKDQPVLIDDKARYSGDAVALVLARDRAVLSEALDLVHVEWEPLPAVFELAEALGTDAPVLHEDHPGKNILLQGEILKGKGVGGFEEAPVVAEAIFEFPCQEHAYLETETGTAILKDDGYLELTVSTQTPFRDRFEMAEALGWEVEKIRIIAPYCGGAFGGKDGITVQSLLALAALHCPGRLIKMWWDREESFLVSAKRHPARLEYRLGAKTDGTFEALEARLYYDTGPYDHLGGAVMTLGLEHAGGPYRIPHVRLAAWAVYTNNALSGAFRGFGVPQSNGAMEQMVDVLAEKLGLDPLELRRRNALRMGDVNPVGVTLQNTCAFSECLDTLAAHPLWQEGPSWKTQAPPSKRRGIGLASVMHGMGYGPIIPDVARAKLELTEEGRFRIYAGVVDMGQGNASTYLQMAGHLLNQEATGLEVVLPDTDRTCPSGSASASRTTYTFGRALIRAAEELKENVFRQAATCLGLDGMADLELLPGRVRHRSTGRECPLTDMGRTLEEAKRTVIQTFQSPVCQEIPTADENLRLHGLPHLIFSYGIHLVYVEVDTLTGRVEVKKYLSVTDCGPVLNRQLYEQQMQGGIAQGLGYALYEDFKIKQGRVQTPNLATYILPLSLDLPDMEILAVENPEPSGPFGLKGAGEIAMDGPLPAVANAVARAIGRRCYTAPITAEKVIGLLDEYFRPYSDFFRLQESFWESTS